MTVLQPRSWAVLRYLAKAHAEAEEEPQGLTAPNLLRWVSKPPQRSPNDIGYEIGQLRARYGRNGRQAGPGSTIVSTLRSLSDQGLIGAWPRPDGRHGVAYAVTPQGRTFLEEHGEPRREYVLCRRCVTLHWRPRGTTRAWQGAKAGCATVGRMGARDPWLDLVPLVGDRWEDAVADARVKGLRK